MNQRTTLENLQLAIHGLTAPFSCEGTFDPDAPVRFVFKDKATFEVARAQSCLAQEKELPTLLKHCKPAPFGDGKKTRYDRKVRDAYQLKAENGVFSIANFDPESAGILKSIQNELVPHDPHPILAELYTVNVYTKGGHFASHKDTPRGEDMLGSLVVCLPSQFMHGDLILNHRGVVKRCDWGTRIARQENSTRLHWVAFFGDVDHQIQKIWGGARVTLTYLLRRGNTALPSGDVPTKDVAPLVHEAWLALLADKSFLPKGGTLGYPCCHLYHQDTRFQRKQRPISKLTAASLKGRDQLVATSAVGAGLSVTFNPYMFEDCADETWQLDRFPTHKEKKSLGWQMDGDDLKHALPILASSEDEGDFDVTWLEDPPSFGFGPNESVDSETPVAALLHHCDYCPWGYFGNESSEVDLYTFAALHIQIPPFGRGIRAAKKSPKAVAGKPKVAAKPKAVKPAIKPKSAVRRATKKKS